MFSLRLASAALGSLLVLSPCAAQMQVLLDDGSTRNGQPDTSTDSRCLRIRFGEPDAYIVYGLSWQRVRQIRVGKQVWGPDQFEAFRQQIVRLAPPGRPVAEPATVQAHSAAASTTARPLASRRVRSLDIDAAAANWDADVQWDGLLVRLRPTDASGRLVPARGLVHLELIGLPYSDNWHVSRATSRSRVQRIGRYTRRVRPQDYHADGVAVRLPFGRYQPERRRAPWHPDHSIATHGEVHVELVVPGQGVFHAATAYPVRLRRFSPLRDRYFIDHGSRFLHFE